MQPDAVADISSSFLSGFVCNLGFSNLQGKPERAGWGPPIPIGERRELGSILGVRGWREQAGGPPILMGESIELALSAWVAHGLVCGRGNSRVREVLW